MRTVLFGLTLLFTGCVAFGVGRLTTLTAPTVKVDVRPTTPLRVELGDWHLLARSLGHMAAPPAPPPHPAGGKADPNRDLEYRLPDSEQPTEIIVEAPGALKKDTADWGHKNIDVADAWKVTKGKGVVVAVLDTGADLGHRDLKGQVKAAKDFTGSRSGELDVNGHGSHVAGVVAAAANGDGMVGVAPECQLLIGKVLDDRGSGLSTWIADGIDWAAENGADVISMSLGGGSPDPTIYAAVRRACDKGVIVVCAAGNAGPRNETIGWPGAYEETICVAATDKSDKVADFSSRGKRLDVAAPGVNVRSCYPGDRFATMSGTSMACPYVAGCAALYVADAKARGVKWSAEDFRRLISAQSKDLPPPGRDTQTGFGLIQPGKMLGGGGVVVPPPDGERIELVIPPEFQGRPIKRIVIEFEPKK